MPRVSPSVTILSMQAVMIILAAAWLWLCFCLYPAFGWNEIRLVPSFMLGEGLPPYPGKGQGPASTWIYGPMPLLLHLPAMLADSASNALKISGAINLGVTVATLAVVCTRFSVVGRVHNPQARLLAFGLCLALWPESSFKFMQADNTAIAAGLLSLLCLSNYLSPQSLWLAAIGCMIAILSKQTMVGLGLAQCLFLLFRCGLLQAVIQGVRILVLTLGAFLATAAIFGPGPLIYNLVTLPSTLPWASSITARLIEFWPYLLVHTGVPLCAGFLVIRRHPTCNRLWLLPIIAWASAWPLDIMSILKTGGSINSLHGWLFFLPLAATLAMLMPKPTARNHALATLIIVSLLAIRLWTGSSGPWLPLTAHLADGDALARAQPGRIYFPWHPLITYYSEQRFYHVEDGLFIRYLAKDPVGHQTAIAHLPPQLSGIAFLKNEMDWGIARSIIPHGARITGYNAWILYDWRPVTSD